MPFIRSLSSPRAMLYAFISVLISCVIGACSTSTTNNEALDLMSEEEIYQEARKNINNRRFSLAIDTYQALDERFPFGDFNKKGQLEIIYAYYKASQFDEAVIAASRFIRLYPEHPQIDYAYYYRGLANFDASQNMIDRFFGADISKRDIGTGHDAYHNFKELLDLYPDSEFANDANARMIYLRNTLSKHESHVADYYLRRGAYAAAANRGRFIVEHYQGSPEVPDGLAFMVQAYRLMGLTEQADQALTTLKTNYPSHASFDKTGQFNEQYRIVYTEQMKKSGNRYINDPDFTPAAPPTEAKESLDDNAEQQTQEDTITKEQYQKQPEDQPADNDAANENAEREEETSTSDEQTAPSDTTPEQTPDTSDTSENEQDDNATEESP